MIGEAVRELTLARKEVGVALDALAGREDRVGDAAPACARAVEGLCAALTELAWAECDRAVYGEGGDAADRLADLIEPSCDRDALLALADKLEEETGPVCGVCMGNTARRIREACGGLPC